MKRKHERSKRPRLTLHPFIPFNAFADCIEAGHAVHIETEADGCYWINCVSCKATGPKSHSIKKAMLRAIITGLRSAY